MLKVNNGKLVSSNMSFALPEDFSLDLKMPGGGYHVLEFVSDNELVKGARLYINVELEEAELTAKEAMEEFIEDCELKLKGDFFPVTRGEGTALAAVYTGGKTSQIYEERYDFKQNSLRQNQVKATATQRCESKCKLRNPRTRRRRTAHRKNAPQPSQHYGKQRRPTVQVGRSKRKPSKQMVQEDRA